MSRYQKIIAFAVAGILSVVIVAWYRGGSVYFALGFPGSLIAIATLSALVGVVLILT